MENHDQIAWSRGKKSRFSRTMRAWFWSIISVFLVISISLATYTFIQHHTLEQLEQQEHALVQEVAELDVLNNQQKTLANDAQQLDLRFSKIQKVTCTSKNNPYPYLHTIEKIIPENTVLTLFAFDRKKIHLEGRASRVHEVTTFMRALAKSKGVKLPQLITLERNKQDGHVRFVINAVKS